MGCTFETVGQQKICNNGYTHLRHSNIKLIGGTNNLKNIGHIELRTSKEVVCKHTIFFESSRFKPNCHYPLTKAASHTNNTCRSCITPIKSTSVVPVSTPLATATIPTSFAPTPTATTTDKLTKQKAGDAPKSTEIEGYEKQQGQRKQDKCLECNNSGTCKPFCCNTTADENKMASTMARSFSSNYTLQALLGHTRNVLTTRLASVSSKLFDNFSYYSDVAAVATTLQHVQLTHIHHIKMKKKKRRQKLNALQCQRHPRQKCCPCDMLPISSPISANSETPKTAETAAITPSSPSLSTTLHSNRSIRTSSPTSPSATVCPPSAAPTIVNTVATPSTTTTAYNYAGHNYYHLLRNAINFYAASSVILVLCYLTTTISAATATSEPAPLEKHPISNIDWSKFDESSSDKEILDMLLEKKRYDKRLLPPVNDEDFCCGLSSPDMAINQNARRPHRRGTLTVNVNVLLLSLASPDESSLKYEVEFLLNQQWNDPRLQYGNKSHYEFLNALHHHDSIWTPDTYFIMHGDFKDPIIPMHFALRIYRNGTITYAMRRHLILSCQGSLHIFPFDDPKCSFSMESISYEVAQIKYVWKNDEDTLRKSPSLTSLNAYLIKNQTTACEQTSWRGNYSCLRVDLIFTRDRAFYFTTVFIPGIILVTSSFITFWLEWNAVPARSMIGNYSCLEVALTFTRDRAYYFTTVFIPGIILVTSSFITFWLEWNAVPARVMIGVTTMLNFFTTSNGFRSTLPVVSNLTAMNVWDGVCMCFIYASLLEFVCVNYVGRKRPLHNVVYRPGENPVTQRLPAVLSRIGVILASPLEIIEREFQTALSSEKAAAGLSSTGSTMPQTPTSTSPHFQWERQHGGGMIGAAVKNLRARSMRRRCDRNLDEHYNDRPGHALSPSMRHGSVPESEHTYVQANVCVDRTPQTTTESLILRDVDQTPSTPKATVPLEDDFSTEIRKSSISTPRFETVINGDSMDGVEVNVHIINDDKNSVCRQRAHSMATFKSFPLVLHKEDRSQQETCSDRSENGKNSVKSDTDFTKQRRRSVDVEWALHTPSASAYPLRPPRKKTSRSTSPAGILRNLITESQRIPSKSDLNAIEDNPAATSEHVKFAESADHGEKRREAGAPNEIVACTTCGGSSSPCTHSANNGCATETCFVQVRKKEPPHPIRVAKTIDVIARITFPTAYAIFLIFFFVHYKGFS